MQFRSRIATAAFLLFLTALLGAATGAYAAITLTQAPAGMRKQSAEITVAWTGAKARVHLRASTVPGGSGAAVSHYDSLHLPSQPSAGSYTFKINPDIPVLYRNTDLRFGINYCILTDGTESSPEFILIIESGSAPVLVSPANAASITDLTPTFTWTGDAPYYALLLSDEPFKIADDGTVNGVSAIWQVITPYRSVRYGDPDPSGFNTVPAPPLISGKTYNWLVLNNYGNNSASTSKVAPVPASFVYSPSAPLPASQLLEPKDKDTIPGSDRILFRWSQVDGAVSYKIELLEENLVDGSQADIALWKASSTGGQVYLDNAGSLLRRYTYKWRVYAIGNNGAASLSAKRSFFYAAEVGEIALTVKNEAGMKVAYAPVKVNRLGGASSAVFQGGSTDNDGVLSIPNAPLGSYESRIENLDGYQQKIDTIVLASSGVTSRTITLKPVQGKVLGKVISAKTGTGLLNAKITLAGSDGSQLSAVTNSQGDYSLGIPLGNWQVRAQADGFSASAATAVTLNSTTSSKTADFSLTPNKFTLAGTVRNSFTGMGIFGAQVALVQNAETRTANTDGNGGFSFSVSGGSAVLRVSNAGFAAPEPMTVAIEGDKSVNLSLDPNASILSGRTRDASGTAVTGAVIQATPKAGPVRTVVSDGLGVFEISLPAGDWSLGATATGYTAGSPQKFLLDASKTVQGIAFVLTANRSFIKGRVTVNGTGLAGAKIASAEAFALSDNSGYYLLPVAAGARGVSASRDGYLIPKTYSVPVNPGDTVAGIDFAASGNAGVVKGRVLAGGAGVVGAVATATNQSNQESFQRTTDATGSFVFSLPGADYKMSASKEGFAPDKVVSFSLPPGGTLLDADVHLTPDQGGITGTVSSGNASLGGCPVSYRNTLQAAMTGTTVTDPQGRYSLSLQAGAPYALTPSCQGYQAATAVTAALARGGALVQDFNLAKAGAAFQGKAVNGKGAVLSGVKVTASKNGEAVTTVTDFAGQYVLSLGAGTYSMVLSRTGYRTVTRTRQLALGANTAAPDTLVSSVGRLSGRAVSDGAGVAGALATLTGLSPEAGGGTFITDADGRFYGENLPAGTYSLAISAEGYSEGRLASLTIVAGGQASAEIGLIADKGLLTGTVKADGAAVADVTIVANAYGVSRSALSGADGKYRIDKLPAGIYSVSTSLAGYSADQVYEAQSLPAAGSIAGLDFNLARNAGSLSGTVTGAGSASGLRIALVGKKGYRCYASCDGSGLYSFPSLPADTYAFSIAAPGYKLSGSTQSPEVAVTGATVFNPALLPAEFRLSGKALNQSGAAIQGIPVELRAADDLFKTATGADGSYAFSEVAAGQEYRLSLKPPTGDFDARDTSFTLGLDAPDAVTADLRTLSRLAKVSGTIYLDDKPIEGATLRLTGSGNNLTAISQPAGLFQLTGVAGSADNLELSVSIPGAGALDTSFSVPVAQSKSGLSLRLRTLKVALSIGLEDSEGGTIPGAKVALASPDGLDTLTTDAQGGIFLTGLPANRSLTLATLLDEDDYDNSETPVFLGEKDTTLSLKAAVHAAILNVLVRDQDGNAVEGADVILNGDVLGKTVQGKIAARHLARGSYRLAAGKAAYKSGADTAFSLSGDTTASAILILTRLNGGLYGAVSDSGVESPSGANASASLPGAVVTVYAGADTLRDTVTSLGQYALEGLAENGKYTIALTLPGYLPRIDSVVAGASAAKLDLRMHPIPGTVLGRLAGGKAGVTVLLTHAASGRILSAATRIGGYYAFTGLQNRNDYTVQAIDGNSSSRSFPFQADAAAAKRFDPALDQWGAVAGTVRGGADAPGSPVAGALVSIRNTLDGITTWTRTDSLGRYSLEGLASGAHMLSIDRIGYRSAGPLSVAISKGTRVAGRDFLLEETEAGISGLVADESGLGLSATVTLVRGSDTLTQECDGSGQFVFGGQGASTYRLSAAKAGYAAPAPVEVEYAGKGIESRNIVLARRGRLIQGLVRDALTNRPVAGAQVTLVGSSTDTAVADSLGRFELATAAGTVSPVYLDATLDGYLPRKGVPVYLDADGSAVQDIVLTADYEFDGEIAVTVKEGNDPVPGLFLTVQSFHPDDSLRFSVTGTAPNSFRGLRRPAPYTLKVKRDGFPDLVKVVDLTAKAPKLDVTLSYPTSRIRVFVTSDGRHGKGVEPALDGKSLAADPDTAGLYSSEAKLKPGAYEVTIKDPQAGLIPMSPYFVALGEDSVRTDTLSQPFFSVPIADSILGVPLPVAVRRSDSLRPAPAVVCSLYYRPAGDPLWKKVALDSIEGGFAGTLPEQTRAGEFEYYHVLESPQGARIATVTPADTTVSAAPTAYSGIQNPSRFSLRDPFLLNSIALLPQRLEADTSLYSLGARDLYEVQVRGEGGTDLDAYFDAKAADHDTGFSVDWSFADAARAKRFGLSLTADPESPRTSLFLGGSLPSDTVFRVNCSVRMGAVRLEKSFAVSIQDLTPVSIGIRYVKENQVLEEDGAALQVSNLNPSGYRFSAFAKTGEGRMFNIAPRWSLGEDSAAGGLSQTGLFIPDSAVARSAAMRIYDTLQVATSGSGAPLYRAFASTANLATFAQVTPSSQGRTRVTDGEGAVLDFNLAGLSKAFTVSVKKPKVSGLLRASPQEQVVGEILDIELSEHQPFKADSGAVLRLPVREGVARKRTVFLGHWNTARLAWERVDSVRADTAVAGNVYSFSKYAVIMGSLPLGAYDFFVTPNPFTSEDPWGLQLGYKVSSEVSSQVGVRVEVYNMMGDKVYESREVQLSKDQIVEPGTHKAAVNSPSRKAELGPFVWDGHDNKGVACRNGRYLLKLIVRDGQGRKEYLKKVVMLK